MILAADMVDLKSKHDLTTTIYILLPKWDLKTNGTKQCSLAWIFHEHRLSSNLAHTTTVSCVIKEYTMKTLRKLLEHFITPSFYGSHFKIVRYKIMAAWKVYTFLKNLQIIKLYTFGVWTRLWKWRQNFDHLCTHRVIDMVCCHEKFSYKSNPNTIFYHGAWANVFSARSPGLALA